MSKNLTRKGMALVSGSALVLTSLVGVAAPATAAPGDVTLAPTSGTGTTAFSTDVFSLSTTVKSVVSPTRLAYKIDNPDQYQLFIELAGNSVGRFDIIGYTAAGASVDTGDLGADLDETNVVVDFEALGITSVVIHTIEQTGAGSVAATAATGNVLRIAIDESDEPNASRAQTLDALEYGELTGSASVTVQSWVEVSATPNYATVDADFASSATTVTFVDPSSVSVIPRVERIASASLSNRITNATLTVRTVATADLADIVADGGMDLDPGDTVGGVVLAAGDRVLLTAQNTDTENGIYTITAAGTNPTATNIGLLAADLVLVLEGTGRGVRYAGAADGNTVSANAGTAATQTLLNAGDDNGLGSSLDFSNPAVNLAQVDLSKWEVSVVSSSTDDLAYGLATVAQVATPAGYTAIDGLGRLFLQVPVADLNLNDGETYSLKYRHAGDTVAPIIEFTSPGYQVVEAPAAHTAEEIKAAPTTSADASVGAWDSGYPVAVRRGVATVTYKSQIMTAAAANVETANVPVLAVVTAGANFPSGATLTVSGATETIRAKSATMLVTGLTDSKGNWSVSVTSSDTSSAGAAYTIQFWVLDEATPDAWLSSDGTNAAQYKASYAGASLAASGGFTADSSVLSGENPTVVFSVKDQFGQPLSATAGGSAYSVELKAPVKTNLEQFVAVKDGKATFTFKNYLKAGESDIITGRLFTGTSTSPSYVAGATVSITLYNTNAVAAVNVPAEVTAVEVTYDDFITGVASSTNVAPTDGNNNGTGEDFVYNGTVVDANGAGVPGASVTIAGKGFQFVRNGGDTYFVDSITLAASEAGTFSVRGWTTVASSTGNRITVTAAGKTASTLVKSVLPTNTSTKNLQLSWNLPASVVMNVTYSITATLADKWGNPISGATIDFNGYGAAQFNGVATATRLTDKSGKATAFLRSLKDVDGVSAIGLELRDTNTDSVTYVNNEGPAAVYSNASATKWDESKWSSVIEASVDFLSTAPASAGEVAIGSFNGRAAVRVEGLKGSRLSVKIGKQWYVVASIPTDRYVWSVKATKGSNVKVFAYINGDLENTQTVTIK